jgi:hypothetical protein
MAAVDPPPRGEAAPAPAPVLKRSTSIDRIPEDARRILHRLAGDLWGSDVDPSALTVSQLKGAMTNEVFRITWPGGEGDPRKVLVRIYGRGVEVFFDRADEVRTFECMSRHGQGPRLLGRFANGRVEEFIYARVRYASTTSMRLLESNGELSVDYCHVMAHSRVLALSDALCGGSARPGDIRADCQEAAGVSRSRHAWT